MTKLMSIIVMDSLLVWLPLHCKHMSHQCEHFKVQLVFKYAQWAVHRVITRHHGYIFVCLL